MADVHMGMRRRPVPVVERVMRTIETQCRVYDKSIVRTMWVVLAFIVWMVVADSLVSTQTVAYHGAWTVAPTAAIGADMPRAEERTMYRVLRAMELECARAKEDVVLAPQVHVDGRPYMHNAMRLCAHALELVNPEVAVTGSKTGICVDEHDGSTRHTTRSYPITLHSGSAPPVTFLELAEVCTVSHALALLAGKW
jgi:hypothetical protein